jgi:hypothetical protein
VPEKLRSMMFLDLPQTPDVWGVELVEKKGLVDSVFGEMFEFFCAEMVSLEVRLCMVEVPETHCKQVEA